MSIFRTSLGSQRLEVLLQVPGRVGALELDVVLELGRLAGHVLLEVLRLRLSVSLWLSVCFRVVGNGIHLCDTTKRVSQRLTPHMQGEIPESITEVGINPLIPQPWCVLTGFKVKRGDHLKTRSPFRAAFLGLKGKEEIALRPTQTTSVAWRPQVLKHLSVKK